MKKWTVFFTDESRIFGDIVSADLWTINHGALLFWRTEGKVDHLIVGFAPGTWSRIEPA